MEGPVTPPQGACPFCEIADEAPKMTFPCQHAAHTACFLERVRHDFVACPTCNTVVFDLVPPGIRNEEDTKQIQKLYAEDTDFSKNVLKYVRALREESRAERAMGKFMKQRKTIYTDEIRLMKERLKEIQTYERKRLRTSTEFKAFKKAERNVNHLLETLHPTKSFSYRELRKALKGKPKLKVWPFKWRRHLRGQFFRYFYYRISM